MSDAEQPPDNQAEGTILGRLPRGSADSHLKVRSRLPDPPPEPRPQLPKGAWLRLRISGGLVFRSSEALLFNDDRLTYKQSASPVSGQLVLARRLTSTQAGELRQMIAEIDLAALAEHDAGRLGADRLAYELTLRSNRKLYVVEALQGALPEPLAQIVRQIGQLVRVAAEETEV
jgi:hypothetical protein